MKRQPVEWPRRAVLAAGAMAAGTLGAGLLGARAQAQGPEPLRVGYADGVWPLSRARRESGAEGLLVDLMDLVGAKAGLVLAHAAFPWARTQVMVEKGKLDMLVTVATPERQRYARFSSSVIFSYSTGMFHRADDARPSQVKSLADLQPLRQVAMRGVGFTAQFLDPGRAKMENDLDSSLRTVAAGQADYLLSPELLSLPHIQALGLTGKLAFTPLAFLPLAEYRVGIRTSHPEADAVLAAVDRSITASRRAGALEALSQRYARLFAAAASAPASA